MYAIENSLIFLFGAMIGSFLNVCIARIPNGESIVHPRSRCPECKASIVWFDNIPLLSYLLLRGQCRACARPIPLRYPLVELVMGSLSLVLFWRFGLGFSFFVEFMFVAALVVISFVDLDVRIVPDVISLPGIGAGLVFAVLARYWLTDPQDVIPSPLNALLGIVIGGGFLFATAWIYQKITGVEGMGGGDIKLLAMIGAFLGWQGIPLTIFFASLAGSLIGIVLMIYTGAGRRLALPFAPFLCTGALLQLFFGQHLLALYFG